MAAAVKHQGEAFTEKLNHFCNLAKQLYSITSLEWDFNATWHAKKKIEHAISTIKDAEEREVATKILEDATVAQAKAREEVHKANHLHHCCSWKRNQDQVAGRETAEILQDALAQAQKRLACNPNVADPIPGAKTELQHLKRDLFDPANGSFPNLPGPSSQGNLSINVKITEKVFQDADANAGLDEATKNNAAFFDKGAILDNWDLKLGQDNIDNAVAAHAAQLCLFERVLCAKVLERGEKLTAWIMKSGFCPFCPILKHGLQLHNHICPLVCSQAIAKSATIIFVITTQAFLRQYNLDIGSISAPARVCMSQDMHQRRGCMQNQLSSVNT